MDKNTIVGFVLIAAVLFGFNWFTRPSTEEIQEQRKQDSIAALVKEKEEIQIKKAQENQIEAQMAALQDVPPSSIPPVRDRQKTSFSPMKR